MTLIVIFMNIDYRSNVIFLHEKGKNASEITIDINETFKAEVIKYSTVTKYIRMKIFDPNNKPKLKKDVNTHRFYLSDIVLKTLHDFTFFSIRQISEYTSIPATTVYRILYLDLKYQIKHLKWVPHLLNPSQKVSRVELSKSLLKTIQTAKHYKFEYFYTGDESWFYLSTDHKIMWLPPDEIPPFIEKKTKYSKKFMLTIFWNINGFPIVEILPDGEKFTAEYFVNNIFKA